MFISKKDYHAVCDRAKELKEQLNNEKQKVKELSEHNKELSDDRYAATTEVIIYKNAHREILDIIESNPYGRTDKQKLDKIKELAETAINS